MRAFIASSRGLSRARRPNYRGTLHISAARPAGETASAVGRLTCATHDHGAPSLDFRLIFSSLQVGYLKIDRGYVVRDVNAVALDWLGLTRSDVVGCPFSQLSPRSPMTMLRSVVEGTVYIDKEQISYRRPDRYMLQHIYPAEDGAVLLFRDITDQKRAQTGAARTQKLLQASLDALVAQVVVLDQSGIVIASNQAWQRFAVGHSFIAANDAGPLHYFNLYAEPHVRRTDARRIASALTALLDGHRRSVHLVYALHVAGQVRWFHLSAARFAVENEIYVAVTSEDVTAVKEAQHTLGEASERLMELRDEERRRIAEELHDSTAQHLVAIGLNVMGLQTRKDPRGSQALLREIEESLEEASRELRSFTYLLHPPRLEQDGLHLTLQRYAEGFARRTGLKLALRMPGEVDGLTFALQITVFRIVQEGLANVHRHASASRVAIDLRLIRGQLHLIVSDDGRGFKSGIASRRGRDAPSRMGVGIPGIKARLRQFGGELVVRSGQNGTRLHGVMPVRAVATEGGPEIVAPLGGGLISPPLAGRHDISLDALHHHDAAVRSTDQS